MASFNSAVTTDQGITLVADLLAGQQIVFTKLVTGSGVYTNEDVERTKLQKATALRDQRQEFEISSITKTTDTCVLLKTLISNKELTRGYRMTEIGVYAKKQGDEGDGILYSVAVAKEADYLPCYNGLETVKIEEQFIIVASGTTEVSIQGGDGASIPAEELKKLQGEIAELKDKIERLTDKNFAIQDTPVGHIIAYMGYETPKNYLECDGTEYNIADYPYLAEHFQRNFDDQAYFGGDGITTFAVPNLCGEFLRGWGYGEVGEHQDATAFPNYYTNNNYLQISKKIDSTGNQQIVNMDSKVNPRNQIWQIATTVKDVKDNNGAMVTTRPTNTSVMYCIKCEPTSLI